MAPVDSKSLRMKLPGKGQDFTTSISPVQETIERLYRPIQRGLNEIDQSSFVVRLMKRQLGACGLRKLLTACLDCGKRRQAVNVWLTHAEKVEVRACRVVSVDFVQENFCIVVARQQDFELQGSGFIFQATGFVRH